MVTLEELKQSNLKWFSPENKKFFGDIAYSVINTKEGESYLVRSTYMWSDMFGGKKTKVYRINTINKNLSIGELDDRIFNTLQEVKNYLK